MRVEWVRANDLQSSSAAEFTARHPPDMTKALLYLEEQQQSESPCFEEASAPDILKRNRSVSEHVAVHMCHAREAVTLRSVDGLAQHLVRHNKPRNWAQFPWRVDFVQQRSCPRTFPTIYLWRHKLLPPISALSMAAKRNLPPIHRRVLLLELCKGPGHDQTWIPTANALVESAPQCCINSDPGKLLANALQLLHVKDKSF